MNTPLTMTTLLKTIRAFTGQAELRMIVPAYPSFGLVYGQNEI